MTHHVLGLVAALVVFTGVSEPLPSTRHILTESDCTNLACKLSVRWANQPRLGEGCERIFFDVGANLGIHGRFLLEPEVFPNNKYHEVFERAFGADWNQTDMAAKQRYCVVAFEPNPAHRAWHVKQATSYQKYGWKYATVFAAAGAGVSGEKLAFYGNPHEDHNAWGFSVSNKWSNFSTDVPVANLANFLHHHVGPAVKKTADRKILMKMDIEGAEFAVLPHMIESNSFHFVDMMTMESHHWMCPITLSIGKRKVTFDEPTCKKMADAFPGQIRAEGCVYSALDDESYIELTPDTMPAFPEPQPYPLSATQGEEGEEEEEQQEKESEVEIEADAAARRAAGLLGAAVAAALALLL